MQDDLKPGTTETNIRETETTVTQEPGQPQQERTEVVEDKPGTHTTTTTVKPVDNPKE